MNRLTPTWTWIIGSILATGLLLIGVFLGGVRGATPRTRQAPPVETTRFYKMAQTSNGYWYAMLDKEGVLTLDEARAEIKRRNDKPQHKAVSVKEEPVNTKVKVKSSCGCSPSCTCGCQDGGECTCGQIGGRAHSEEVVRQAQPGHLHSGAYAPAPPVYYQPQPQYYQPQFPVPTYSSRAFTSGGCSS